MTCQNPLTSNQIRQKLKDHTEGRISSPSASSGRKAAVLVPILCLEDGWHILYTRRSELVNDHKGQVSFPGGSMEATDRSVVDTALREAFEEIGIEPSQVDILGRLDDIVSISGFLITPVVGQLHWPVSVKINYQEVSRIFSIPLAWLSIAEHYESRLFKTPAGSIEPVYFYEPYDSEQLWGISARITLQLLEVLGQLNGRLS